MEEQIELDKLTAKEAIVRYVSHYLIPERSAILEDLICELANEGIIIADWIEIY